MLSTMGGNGRLLAQHGRPDESGIRSLSEKLNVLPRAEAE